MRDRQFSLLFLFVFPGFQALAGQTVETLPDVNPPLFALQGATVHVGDGQIISNATVVIRDGLIEAVGSEAAVPEGAWALDLQGLHIYPGFIDALTEAGLKKIPARESPEEGSARSPRPARTEGAGLNPQVNAADQMDARSSDLIQWRNAGVLALNIAPAEGIFMGQTAVVNLNDRSAGEMIVKTPVALRMSFRTQGTGIYPRSLLGVIAYIRQTLLDARHYGEAGRVYASHIRGLKRPRYDPALEALQPVLEAQLPLIFPARTQREIRRVLAIARQHDLRCIVAGGFEADPAGADLKELRVPVLISLKFPEKPKDRHPEGQEPLRAIRLRQHAPQVPGELENAGVQFAFFSDGLPPGEFREALRKVVDAGLASEAALQAATLSAARILGVDAQLGSIEIGKIANLIVVDGDLFEKDSRIRRVFVDGIKFDVPEKEASSRGKEEENETAQPPL